MVLSFLASLPPAVNTALLLLGSWLALKALLVVLSAVWFVVRPAKNVRKYGEWAVVTGASDGIGFALANELASKGMKIVLMGRDRNKLDDCAKTISSAHRVDIKVVVADMASGDPNMYTAIKGELEGLDIGVLVNNVGRSYEHPEYIQALDDKLVSDILKLNVTAATEMSRIVLKGMTERKRGAIVNIGSAAGFLSTGDPLLSIYSASKAYLDFLSRSLYYELKGKNIHVQCQVPYFVVSKLSKIRKPSLTTPTPEAFAKASLRAIGYGPYVVPYWSHALQHFVLSSLPDMLLSRVLMYLHLSVRKRALAKKTA